MSDIIEPNIFCEFEKSNINPNLYICKYCNLVMSNKQNLLNQNIVCSVRLDRAAQDPRFKQINLVKTTVETPEGKVISTQQHDKQEADKPTVLTDWWFGNSHVNNISINNTPDDRKAPIKPMVENNSTENQCTQEQIDKRLSICKTCEFYKNETCLKCGCALSRERNFMNKLYWKDKTCPIGKWGQEE